MAYLLKLYDGTNTVDFMAATTHLVNGGFSLPPAKKRRVWGEESSYSHGSHLISEVLENKEGTIIFDVAGNTRAGVIAAVKTIENILTVAKRRQIERAGPRVELQFQWDSASNISYHEVIGGDVVWPEDLWSVEQLLQTDNLGRYVVRNLTLQLILSPFGYAISPVNGTPPLITISNSSGSGTTRTVWNHDDSTSGHDSWIEIDNTQIGGDFPALLSIEMTVDTPLTDPNVSYNPLFVGAKRRFLSSITTWEDNASEATVTGSPTPTVCSTCSGGYYTSISLAFNGTSVEEIDAIKWTYTITQTANTKGLFRVFARCYFTGITNPTDKVSMHLELGKIIGMAKSLYYETEPISMSNRSDFSLVDFGYVTLPPWGEGLSDDDPYEISVTVNDTYNETISLKFDSLIFIPVTDGFRQYIPVINISEDQRVIDDAWNNIVYKITSANKQAKVILGMYPRIEAMPGETMRLYFISGSNGDMFIDNNLTVAVRKVERYNLVI